MGPRQSRPSSSPPNTSKPPPKKTPAPPADEDDDPSLLSWSAGVLAAIARGGIEKALVAEAPKIAQVALDNPRLLQRFSALWMLADPETRDLMPPVPEGADPDKLSFEDVRKMRHLKGIFRDDSSDDESSSSSSSDGVGERIKRPFRVKLRRPDKPVPGVNEADGSPVTVFRREDFVNWGRTVRAAPEYTFVPHTVAGIREVVRFAKREGRRVRAAGSTHTWSSLYCGDGDILIMLTPPRFAEGGSLHPPNPQDVELERIRLVGEIKNEHGVVTGGLVRIGASATSDHFRAWVLQSGENGGNRRWVLPALPILVEITFGGNIMPMCHGAGLRHKTVSDLVHEVEFVNARGELQRVSDPQLLQAAAGCFGLLGIVTAITFRVDPFTQANFFPRNVPTVLAVPPPTRSDIPSNQSDFSTDFTDAQIEAARTTFIADAHKYYSEWFWFPFQEECWINVWDNDGTPDPSAPIHPDEKEVRTQSTLTALSTAFEVTFLRFLRPITQARLMGAAAMKLVLPAGELISTPLSEALHFQRGIHRIRVFDMEIEIPIPPRADNPSEPDWTVVQKAWWMAIQEVYAHLPRVPMRTTLEMRIIGDSDMTMSTQRGNKFGTCSIEVLTSTITDESEWMEFKQALLNRWASLADPSTGGPLNVRPHWAKEWEGLSFRNLPAKEYLKTVAYKSEIPTFREKLAAVAEAGNYKLSDAFDLFGNDTILDIISA